MFSKFLSLPAEKQTRIINAALKEFAQKGFHDASTNEIVKEANISKGLLFHYFQNKKLLYLFLYDYCIGLALKEIYGKINFAERDLFVRIRQGTLAKIDLLNRYPEMFRFLETMYVEEDDEVRNDLEERQQKFLTIGMGKLYEGIDLSCFKAGMDLPKVMNIITWTFEGFAKGELYKSKLTGQLDYTKLFAEADLYIEVLKNSFYKSPEGGQNDECD